MFADGYVNIINIDYSQALIKAMSEKYKNKPPTFKYILMDARKMTFPDSSFDIVIDKGTMDAILCGDNSVENVDKMISEIHRVLTPTGIYISITYGTPESRKCYLEKSKFNWNITIQTVKKSYISSFRS